MGQTNGKREAKVASTVVHGVASWVGLYGTRIRGAHLPIDVAQGETYLSPY